MSGVPQSFCYILANTIVVRVVQGLSKLPLALKSLLKTRARQSWEDDGGGCGIAFESLSVHIKIGRAAS